MAAISLGEAWLLLQSVDELDTELAFTPQNSIPSLFLWLGLYRSLAIPSPTSLPAETPLPCGPHHPCGSHCEKEELAVEQIGELCEALAHGGTATLFPGPFKPRLQWTASMTGEEGTLSVCPVIQKGYPTGL